MCSTDGSQLAAARRQGLFVSVASICNDVGFGSADKACIETLTEILQSYITELGRTSRMMCELSGRTLPLVKDIAMAIVDMGSNVKDLQTYAKRCKKMALHQEQMRQGTTPKVLQAGIRKHHPNHIPHYLPEFPDPHSYIKTATYRQQEKDYQTLREKAATQKRDVERALTRFIAKTGETQTLFPGDSNLFPLIACTPSPHPYLPALLPPEHEVLAMAEEDMMKEKAKKEFQRKSNEDAEKLEEQKVKEEKIIEGTLKDKRDKREAKFNNPYLRKVKKPKVKKSKGR
ncbi:transcription initiation factor TFIID subunit 8-like [Anneissia japonica]|uniref:transcription initiation factor TFIID subunit 8-like n=1 Tax=Anneissia japonica TaxID=1529436 RepID=UPI001425B8C8|nr:transcription initiation factor TFIID subunit 8-like [Anneissia japonica]